MVGYAIAALKKEKTIVGLKVKLLENDIIKDLTLQSVKVLYGKDKNVCYNFEKLDNQSIQNLPMLDVNTGKLSKDVWTILLNVGKQYLVCNPKGDTYSISEEEARKFRFTNAKVEAGVLTGRFVIHDEGEKQYDSWLLFNHPVQIESGELYIKNDETGPILELPSIVTSFKPDCWKNAADFETVRLSANIKVIGQGDLDGLHTKDLLIPAGVGRFNSFAFSGCIADRVIIEGNTIPAIGLFNNASISEVYVNNALINKYRSVVVGSKVRIKGLGEIEW